MTLNPFRPAQFLADIASPFTTPGLGPIAGYTNRFALNLVNFDWTTWHQYEWQNWQQVDALIGTITELIGVEGIRGIWQPSTAYSVDDIVYDPADLTLTYICIDAHTSSSSFVTDEPLYWNPSLDFSSGLFAATGPLPRIQFVNTSAVAPAGAYRIVAAVDDSFRIEKNTAVAQDFSTVSLLMTIEAAGTAISDATAAVTKEKGDLRYPRLAATTLQTFSGPLRVNDLYIGATAAGVDADSTISAVSTNILVLQSGSDGLPNTEFRRNNGTLVARVDTEGTNANVDTTLITREKGDARYVSLGGAASNAVTKIGNIVIAGTPAGTAQSVTISAVTGNGLTMRGGVDIGTIVQFQDATGNQIARITVAGTAMSDPQDIVTQEKGDERYLQLAVAGEATAPLRVGDIYVGGNPVGGANEQTIAWITGTGSLIRSGLDAGTLHHFQNASGTVTASVAIAGTSAPNTHTIITKEKGGALYAPISSQRFKDDITPATFDALDIVSQLQPQTWVWGGEVHPTHERYGTVGLGLISEDVEPILSAAVTYQWVPDEEGNNTNVKMPHGLDALALIGVLVKSIQELTARVAALEGV